MDCTGENQRRNREYWDRPEWQMPSDYIKSHAHNQLVNVLSTTGLVGLFFFLLFTVNYVATNVRLFKHATKASLQEKWLLICLTSQFAFILSCLSDVTFEYAKLRILILIPWALLMSLKQGEIQ